MCTEENRLLANNYFDTYALVVTCFAIRLLIICAVVLN